MCAVGIWSAAERGVPVLLAVEGTYQLQGTGGKRCPALAVNRLWTKPPAERPSSELLTNHDLTVHPSSPRPPLSIGVRCQARVPNCWNSDPQLGRCSLEECRQQHPALWEALEKRRLGQEEVGSTQEDLRVGFEDRLTSRSSSGAALVNALHSTGRDRCSLSRAGWMLCAKLSLVSFLLRAFFIH